MSYSSALKRSIYNDDDISMKNIIQSSKKYILNQQIYCFILLCGSEKCLKCLSTFDIKHLYVSHYHLYHSLAVGGNLSLIKSLNIREYSSWSKICMVATALDHKDVIKWITENELLDEHDLEEYRDNEDLIAFVDKDEELDIQRPRMIRSAWEMDSNEYDQYIQWLPREVFDDIEDLWIDEVLDECLEKF